MIKKVAVLSLLLVPSIIFAQTSYNPPSGGGGGGGASVTTGTGAPASGDCDESGEVGSLYLQSGDPASVNLQFFRCTQTGPASYAWHPTPHIADTTAPAICTTGNLFFDTDASAGSNLFGCTSADTWTLLGGGVGDPGSNGIMARTAANTSTARTITGGSGISVSDGSGVSGDPTISGDRTVIPFKGSGTADPPAACGDPGVDTYELNDFYLETDTNEVYVCKVLDTWELVNIYATTDISGAGWFIDEDDMSSDDATKVPSQQSVKAYVDASGGGGTFDPSITYELYEEFGTGYNSSGNLGTYGWPYGDLGTPSGDQVQLRAGLAENPGSLLMETGTTADAGVRLQLGGAGGYGINTQGLWQAHDFEMDVVIELGTISTESVIWIGFSTSTNLYATDGGIWLIRDTDHSHTNFVAAICNTAGSAGCDAAGDDTNQESVTSSVSISNDTTYRFRIRQSMTEGPGSSRLIGMRVNDETEMTFCSSGCSDTITNARSTGQMNFVVGIATNDTNENDLEIDYIYLKIDDLDRY
jgi:hypothetical protein